MSFWRRLRGVLLLGVLSLAASGCPVTLQDDFYQKSSGTAGSASDAGEGGSGNTDTAGTNSTGGDTPKPNGGESSGGTPAGGSKTGGTDAGGSSGGQITGQAGDGAGEGGGAGDPGVSMCPPDLTFCSGTCTDVLIDEKNCRKCGNECLGTTCDNGFCTNDCLFGRADCNRNLVDGCEINPANDPKNCGNCGIKCGFQMECAGGDCVCPPNTADCDGNDANGCEIDTSSDVRSCGACGKACGVHQACVSSNCECAPGFADCNLDPSDGCEASLTDAATCGSCSFNCGPHSACVANGQCSCLDGFLDCDANTAGCETPTTDPLHCGTCDASCQEPTPACDGSTCNSGCGSLTKCGASCVDLTQDPQNCGACGTQVGAHQLCVNGKPECVTGYGDCDGDPSECEVNLDSDAQHCGDCTTTCKPGALCSTGSCGCAPGTPNDCGASCEKCCNDAQCSDGDSCTADTCNAGSCSSGVSCAGGSGLCCAKTGCFECCGDADCGIGKICSGNKCVTLTCTPPLIACDSKCVNPSSDAANCNGCGNSCGKGRSCSNSACAPKWTSIAAAPAGFVARQKAAYTALGSKVFVWGGVDASGTNLGNGALYDASTDAWALIGSSGSPPSARVLASAVWTGTVVVVWGGGNAASSQDYTSGGRYDPATDSWLPISTVGAPTGRRAAHAYWTGSRVLIFGGYDAGGNASVTVSLYDPVNDKWSVGSTNNDPAAARNAATAWTGSQLVVYGGQLVGFNNYANDTHSFDPATNVWKQVKDGPSGRAGVLAAWDGSRFVAWGGTSATLKNDGQHYEPSTDKWTPIPPMGAPSARWAPTRQAGWAARIKPSVTLLLGGVGANSAALTDGATFNSASNAWAAVAAWPSGASHQWGVGVWTGSEYVLWSGLSGTGTTLSSAGERYLP